MRQSLGWPRQSARNPGKIYPVLVAEAKDGDEQKIQNATYGRHDEKPFPGRDTEHELNRQTYED
jgi:hypothetical protein